MFKYSKSWFWSRLNDKVSGSDLSRKPVKIQSVYTVLKWFKGCNGFGFNIYAEGGENEIGFYFTIPWLVSLSVSISISAPAFKKWFPKAHSQDACVCYGLWFSREFFTLHIAHFENYDSDTRKGVYVLKDWGVLFKGRNVKIDASDPIPVGQYCAGIFGKTIADSQGNEPVPVTFTVTKENFILHYSRWFPKRYSLFTVTSDIILYHRGKGDNGWDQKDVGVDSITFSTNKSTSLLDAVDYFIKSYYALVAKYGQ